MLPLHDGDINMNVSKLMEIIFPTEMKAVTQTALKPKVNENSVDRKPLFPFRKV